MKIKRAFIGVMALSLIFFAFPAQAAESNTIKESETYTSTDKNKTYSFPDEIERDGKTYRLSGNVQYTIKDSKALTEKQTISESRSYSSLSEQSVDEKITSEEYPDITLTLSDVQYTPSVIESESSTILVEDTTDYGYLISKPTAAQTKEIEYQDNGETKTATAQLLSLSAVSEPTWQDGYKFIGLYYGGNNVKYYQFQNTTIPQESSGEVPYKGYENIILSTLGLDDSIVRIDSASWTGTGTVNGQSVRYATFNCSMLTTHYVATYSTTVPASETVFDAIATYTTKADISTGLIEYEILAEAEYEPVSSSLPIILTISGVVLILLVFAVFLLFHLKKKRRKVE